MKEKAGRKKRIQIRSDFFPQAVMPSGRALFEIAKEKGVESQEEAKRIMGRRKVIAIKNIGKFYVHLFQAMYEGEILRSNEMPLFPNLKKRLSSDPEFFPDIVIDGQKKTTYVEVKAISVNQGKPWFGHRQIAGYCGALLENSGSEMMAGIFKYGGRKPGKLYICKNEDGHRCDNRCLIENLSRSTKSLLIIPHNLLMFLLMLSFSFELNQTSSDSALNFENYKMPYGTWLSFLHKDYENPSKAITKILEHADSKWLGLGDFSRRDFFLDGLEAKQYISPDNVCCKSSKKSLNFKINPFMITEYKTCDHPKWMKHFRGNLDSFLNGLEIKEAYDKKFYIPF